MITAGPYLFLNALPVRVAIMSVDGTADLVDMIARVMQLEPTPGLVDISVYVHASLDPPYTGDLFDASERPPSSWPSYCVCDRVLIRESPSGAVLLCGVPGYPEGYATAQVRWHLASFLVGGLLARLSGRLLLVHGALIAEGSRGHLLIGSSGAGKSTAAARVPAPWRGVADDLVAAVATEDGYSFVPLPTWSVFDRDPCASYAVETARCYSLAGVWFLERAETDSAESVTRADARERLIGNTVAMYGHYTDGFSREDLVRLKGHLLLHANRILDRVPYRVLKVSLEGRFWEQFDPGVADTG